MHTMRKKNITYTILSVTGDHAGHREDDIFMHVLRHILIPNKNLFLFIVVRTHKQTFWFGFYNIIMNTSIWILMLLVQESLFRAL